MFELSLTWGEGVMCHEPRKNTNIFVDIIKCKGKVCSEMPKPFKTNDIPSHYGRRENGNVLIKSNTMPVGLLSLL